MKTCFKCQQEKSLSEFYIHKQMADGHLNKCKDCTKADTKLRTDTLQATNYEWSEKELERQRLKSAKTRSLGKASPTNPKKWQTRNPIKRAAHIAVGNAIHSKRLTKQPCEFCGSEDTQAHHDDYSKPLEVRWLCVPHHAQVHRELNRQRRLERFNAKNQAK